MQAKYFYRSRVFKLNVRASERKYYCTRRLWGKPDVHVTLSSMAKANTSPVSGMRDFLPADVLRRRYVVEVIERVYQAYGFEPLETPAMERLETLLGKYGDEGDQLIFRVMKRGEKLQKSLAADPTENDLSDAGLRYDLTVPLARVIAEYRNRLPRIFKRYQIQPVFRADRPARGRFREFFQCDADIVGSDSPVVEVEVIAAVCEVLRQLGFEDFVVRLNHRRLLASLIRAAGVPDRLEATALVALDKLDKIDPAGVRRELEERAIPPTAVETLLQWIGDIPSNRNTLPTWLAAVLKDETEAPPALWSLRTILDLSESGPAAGRVRIDPFLARGLSYYTGPIFEIEFPDFQASAGGGGRYDHLIGLFSSQPVPACGFSLGLERILLLMEERGLFPVRFQGQPQLLVTLFDEASLPPSLQLATQLRGEGFRVDVYPEPDRYGKQFRYADQRAIRYALLLSGHEREAGVVAVKDLVSGQQENVPSDKLADWLHEHLETAL